GMFMLTLSVSIPMLKPPTCLDSNPNNCKKPSTLQVAVFFGALYTLALGTGALNRTFRRLVLTNSTILNRRRRSKRFPSSIGGCLVSSLYFGSLAKLQLNSSSSTTSPWKLCSVTKVEETKQMVRMLPIWVATFVPSIVLAQINTLFIKQGTTLQRGIGNFEIPPASLSAFVTLTMLISVVLYDWYFVKIIQNGPKTLEE
ncbi:hypothetical protein F8388_003297, partial [Cannabis sativa]